MRNKLSRGLKRIGKNLLNLIGVGAVGLTTSLLPIGAESDVGRVDIDAGFIPEETTYWVCSGFDAIHYPGAEEGEDSYDYNLESVPPNPNEQYPQTYSWPYGMELQADVRPENSLTNIDFKNKVVDKTGLGLTTIENKYFLNIPPVGDKFADRVILIECNNQIYNPRIESEIILPNLENVLDGYEYGHGTVHFIPLQAPEIIGIAREGIDRGLIAMVQTGTYATLQKNNGTIQVPNWEDVSEYKDVYIYPDAASMGTLIPKDFIPVEEGFYRIKADVVESGMPASSSYEDNVSTSSINASNLTNSENVSKGNLRKGNVYDGGNVERNVKRSLSSLKDARETIKQGTKRFNDWLRNYQGSEKSE